MTPINQTEDKLQRRLLKIRRKNEETRAQQLANEVNLPYVNLLITPINPEDVFIIPEEQARQAQVAVIEKRGKALRLAVKNPKRPETIDLIKEFEAQGYQCRLFIVSSNSLKRAWEKYSLKQEKSISLRGVFIIPQKELDNFKESIKDIEQLGKTINKLTTTQLLTTLLAGSIEMGASDVHLEPEKDDVRLRYRIDGLLQDVTHFPKENYKFLVSRIKTLSEMILNQADISQDGRFTVRIAKDNQEPQEIDIRVSILPSSSGESIVMRLLGAENIELNLEELGLNKKELDKLHQEISQPNGMILVTGPTGSGKTTTLYACLNYINKPGEKIITVENPIEYQLEGITQTQINKKKGQDFAQALRAIVRQDPDILMVGEIRDQESAEIAVQFALTGHIVFSTLHTNSAAGAVPRLIDIEVDPSSVASSVNLIIAQRLVRRLCDCKEKYEPDKEVLKDVQKEFKKVSKKATVQPPQEFEFYKAKGCSKCHGLGYKGRVGVFEILQVNNEIKEAILKNPTSFQLQEEAQKQGMVTLLQSGLIKASTGVTSLEEVNRVLGDFE